MQRWLVTTRDHRGTLIDAAVTATLLKAESEGAKQLFDITHNLFSTKSRQHQNAALMYDGESVLTINHGSFTTTLEPLSSEK